MDEATIRGWIKEAIEASNKDIEKILQPVVDTLTEDIQKYLSESVAAVETRVSGLEEAVTAPKAGSKETAKDDPLEARLKSLETQLVERDKKIAEKEAKELDGSFEKALGEALGTHNPMHRDRLQKELYRDLREGAALNGDQWVTKDGKTVSEAAKDFFGSDYGKHFLPSQHKDGAGTEPPGRAKAASGGVDLANELMQAFL